MGIIFFANKPGEDPPSLGETTADINQLGRGHMVFDYIAGTPLP